MGVDILDRGVPRGKRLFVARPRETWYKRALTRRQTPRLRSRLAANDPPRIQSRVRPTRIVNNDMVMAELV